MPLAPPTPRRLVRAAALAPLFLLAACPKPDPLDPEFASGTTDGSESTGTTDPLGGATMTPTTGSIPSDTDDGATTDETTGTTGHDPSDSSGSATTGATQPDFGQCPYEPAGVEAALERVTQGVVADLAARPCGTAEEFASLTVTAAAGDHLEATVCADAACGACDPADTLSLSLTIPGGLAGLPPQIDPGACLQLAVAWDRDSGAPDACTISSLALVRKIGGQPEPVPSFMYRYTETLPTTDVVDSFILAAELDGPGAIACPCKGDCCLDEPGSRRLRFVFNLGKAIIEGPPVESGEVVPVFAFGTPEGDELLGNLALVRSYVPSACDAPARHEWLLRVTPG